VSHAAGPWRGSVEGNVFRADGFTVVRAAQRGAIDVEADSSHETFDGRVEYLPSTASSLFRTGSIVHERRDNGTPLQVNSTEAGYAAGGRRHRSTDGSDWQLALFAHLQTFRNAFSRTFSSRTGTARP
jgi:hypothetical protein